VWMSAKMIFGIILALVFFIASSDSKITWQFNSEKGDLCFADVELVIPPGHSAVINVLNIILRGDDYLQFYVENSPSAEYTKLSKKKFLVKGGENATTLTGFTSFTSEPIKQGAFKIIFEVVEDTTDLDIELLPLNPDDDSGDSAFECGKSALGNRIVGGQEAEPFAISWQVGLSRTWSKKPFCGGTLISPIHVLTAAHCTDGETAEGLQVVVGEHNIETDEDGVVHLVDCIKDHPDYDDIITDNDFSILTLKEPVDITSADSKARAACLPTDLSNLYDNVDLTVSGWGNMRESGGHYPSVLHYVQVPGVTNEVCQADYKYGPITSNMMCAGLDEGGIDACQGDSGGPLTHEDDEGVTSVVGVVSFGIGCARKTHYGVYARVTAVLEWIKKAGVMEGTNKC